jgi:hypothetical protein
MINIHFLPTDKPSRLFVDIDDNKLKITQPLSGEYMMNQNIYITSDEEIKEGDWVITPTNDIIQWAKVFQPIGKKIILTTDAYLIKDGVQAIDDKFLEWFVNNPNCEEVEIKTRYLHSYKTGENFISFSKTPEFSSRNMQCIKIEPRYEIIIPQEEPKQENCCTPAGQIKRYVDCVGCDKKPKQMSKPTALDLYEKEINSLIEKYESKEISKREFITMKHNLFYDAKEMEKEQIMEAYMSALPYGLEYSHYDKYANKYYNETYKKEDK